MDLQLTGKRALVIGSTSGIGVEIARMLAREGVQVIVHGRDIGRAQAEIDDIEAESGTAVAALGDLTSADRAAPVITATTQAFGGIDILVNNADKSNGAASGG
jgi:NAD(P)-dependent dehydrogenase (short-subunit alcohol dehydrogenase family)